MGNNVKETVQPNYLFIFMLLFNKKNLFFQNDKITNEFYNMPWYLLPSSHQKLVRSAIHNSQNGPTLSIGPFAEVDFATAANVSFSLSFEYLF